MVILLFWTAGLTLFGVPIWCVLHKLKMRHQYAAMTLGGTLTSFAYLFVFSQGLGLFPLLPRTVSDNHGLLLVDNRHTLHEYVLFLPWLVGRALGGACIGWMIWRMAHHNRSE